MKKSILLAAAFVALIATSCRKIEMDGGGSTVVAPTTPGVQTITLKGRIDKDTVLREGNNYILSGIVYIVNNAKLTIQPGVTVKGDYTGSNVAALVITRGAKIIADGTQDKPIVFTSNSPTPRSGDWGGIVILGKASINSTFTGTGGGAGTLQVEGGIDNSFGDGIAGGGASPNDDDNSGILRTIIDFVQVTYGKDDAFEWFGGTVNCKHLIAYKTQDDDFDADNGFSGKVQFGIVLRDSTIADISRSEAFECDNDPSGSINKPQTTAVFSNITVVGPRATLANKGNSLYLGAAHVRRNTGISIFNSIFLGWPAGLIIDARNGRAQELNILDSTTRFKNNIIAGCGPETGTDNSSYQFIASSANASLWNTDSLKNRMSNVAFSNKVLVNVNDTKLIAPFSYSAPDFIPFGGSNGNQDVLKGASFSDPKLVGFTTVPFRGACDAAGFDANWWKGWTRFVNQ